MRNVIVFINICIVASVTMIVLDFDRRPDAPVSLASMTPAAEPEAVTSKPDVSAAKTKKPLPTHRALSKEEEEVVSTFVTEMAQQRLLERERSKVAAQRGTRRALKDYGAWMVINQQQMLDDLNRVARAHRWSDYRELPSHLVPKVTEFENLHGKKFDAYYIKSITSTLKADIKRLERASYSPDPEIQVFATRYLSITKDNLAKLQRIRKAR